MAKVIKDFDYFRAVDQTIRRGMKRFETQLLPVAEKAIKDAGFSLGDYPVEGYYSETPELKRYFLCLRTLQDKFTEKVIPAIRKLHDIYTHRVFGLKQARRTAINPSDVYFPDLEPVTISPVVDPISVACVHTGPDWTIEKIMKSVDRENLGDGLVGFAYFVDSTLKPKDGKYNPVATCMAAEIAVVSRMKFEILAPPPPEVDWRVSPETEEAGKRVLAAYRDLLGRHSTITVEDVTTVNIGGIVDDLPSPYRCAHLSTDEVTGREDKHYHWAIDSSHHPHENYNGLFVNEVWSPDVITTEEYQKSKRTMPEY